jgi:hypothetical protein
MGFAMFLTLWRLRDHRHGAGWLFGAYCLLAGVERFAVEFFRAKDDRFVGPLSSAQAVAVAVGLLGIAPPLAAPRRRPLRGRRARQRAVSALSAAQCAAAASTSSSSGGSSAAPSRTVACTACSASARGTRAWASARA